MGFGWVAVGVHDTLGALPQIQGSDGPLVCLLLEVLEFVSLQHEPTCLPRFEMLSQLGEEALFGIDGEVRTVFLCGSAELGVDCH